MCIRDSVCIKKIVGIIDAVSAFQKHGNMKLFIEHMRCFFHRCSISDLYSGEIFYFRNIWCDDLCKWKKFFLERFFRIFVHQAMTTSRPVSYTHLDVYKRQAVNGVNSN